MSDIKDIIDEQKIFDILGKTRNPDSRRILKILEKAKEKKGLSLEEVGYLVNASDTQLTEEMFKTAGGIKKEIYGERLVLFAPLYVSNFCVNDCEYCGFHRRNPAPRKKLTLKEVEEQVRILEEMGHKRLLLEFGEDPLQNPIDYVVDVIKAIYNTKSGRGEIRRVNVNIAATTVGNYRKLKAAGIGTYQLFQETYHHPTYKKLHNGPKADFERQLFVHNRALEAGIDDIGLGVLFGLHDWRFEVLALVSHAQYLDKKFGVGPHTISVPRFQSAKTVEWIKSPCSVSDDEFLKIIAILRMAVPYAGMIISTRESPEIRAKAFKIGISQTSAASRTSPGGYGKNKEARIRNNLSQFNIQDERNLDEFLKSALKQGLVPSFCTACYRSERTGGNFMCQAKTGEIKHLCEPNALLTLLEYLEDYASPQVRDLGYKVFKKRLNQLPKNIKEAAERYVARIQDGERDLYF